MQEIFLFCEAPRPDCGPHPVSCSFGARVPSLRVRQTVLDANHSPLPSAEDKNEGALPHSTACLLVVRIDKINDFYTIY